MYVDGCTFHFEPASDSDGGVNFSVKPRSSSPSAVVPPPMYASTRNWPVWRSVRILSVAVVVVSVSQLDARVVLGQEVARDLLEVRVPEAVDGDLAFFFGGLVGLLFPGLLVGGAGLARGAGRRSNGRKRGRRRRDGGGCRGRKCRRRARNSRRGGSSDGRRSRRDSWRNRGNSSGARCCRWRTRRRARASRQHQPTRHHSDESGSRLHRPRCCADSPHMPPLT